MSQAKGGAVCASCDLFSFTDSLCAREGADNPMRTEPQYPACPAWVPCYREGGAGELTHPFLAGQENVVFNSQLADDNELELWPRHSVTLKFGASMRDAAYHIAPDPTYFQTVLQ